MASGSLVHRDQVSSADLIATWTMLDAVAAIDDGVWVDFRGFSTSTLHVSGITTATLEVHASNADSIPADSSDGIQVGTDITADGMTTIVGPYKWIKVKIADWTDGTITAKMTATTRGGGGSGGTASSVTVTGTATVQGEHASNSSNAADKIGTVPAIATASDPTYTEGNQVALSTTLAGALRVTVPDNGMSVDYYPSVTGTSSEDRNQIKASAGTLYTLTCTSIDTTAVYIKLYEKAAPTSTDTVKMKFAISGADAGKVAGVHLNFGPDGIAFATAMGSRYTTAFDDTSTGGVTAGEVICHFGYR